jgi:hypothetical protein
MYDISQVTFFSETPKDNVAEKYHQLESELLKLSGGNVYGNEDEDSFVPETLKGVVAKAEMRELDAQVARERVDKATNQANPSGISHQSGKAQSYRNPDGDNCAFGANGGDGGDVDAINGGGINPFNDDDVSSDYDVNSDHPFHAGDLDDNDAAVEVVRWHSKIFDDPVRRIVCQANDA